MRAFVSRALAHAGVLAALVGLATTAHAQRSRYLDDLTTPYQGPKRRPIFRFPCGLHGLKHGWTASVGRSNSDLHHGLDLQVLGRPDGLQLHSFHFPSLLGHGRIRDLWDTRRELRDGEELRTNTLEDGRGSDAIRTGLLALPDGRFLGRSELLGQGAVRERVTFLVSTDGRIARRIPEETYQQLRRLGQEDLRTTATRSREPGFKVRAPREAMRSALSRFHYPGGLDLSAVAPPPGVPVERTYREERGEHRLRDRWTEAGVTCSLETESYKLRGARRFISHTLVIRGARVTDHYVELTPTRRGTTLRAIARAEYDAARARADWLPPEREELRATATRSGWPGYQLRDPREPMDRLLARFHYPGSADLSRIALPAGVQVTRKADASRGRHELVDRWRTPEGEWLLKTVSYRLGDGDRYAVHTHLESPGGTEDHHVLLERTRTGARTRPLDRRAFEQAWQAEHLPSASPRRRGELRHRLHLVHGLPDREGVPGKRGVLDRLRPRTRAEAAAVAAIYQPSQGGYQGPRSYWRGTAFLVAAPEARRPGLVLTNHHTLVLGPDGRPDMIFRFDDGKTATQVRAARVVYDSVALDAAIVELAPATLPALQPLALVDRVPATGARVVITGYPDLSLLPRDALTHAALGRNYPRHLDEVPSRPGEQPRRSQLTAKSIATGQVTGGDRDGGFHHDAVCEPGNSGSCVSLAEGGAIGLHRAHVAPRDATHPLTEGVATSIRDLLADLRARSPAVYSRLTVTR